MTYKKKLIEVALPLDEINEACVHEKSVPRKGHPATFHVWWSRKPLAAAKAIILASLIDDPINYMDEKAAAKERKKIHRLISKIIHWNNKDDTNLIKQLDDFNIKKNIILDPFSGGGSIPMAAYQMGIGALGSDLNPVAVLLCKAQMEIPSLFSGNKPINQKAKNKLSNANWKGSNGLIDDVKYYAELLRNNAYEKLEKEYPKGPNNETIIGWLWSRGVKCENPACKGLVPFVTSWWLCKKAKKNIYLKPTYQNGNIKIEVVFGTDVPEPTKVGMGANFCCPHCQTLIKDVYVKEEGKQKRIYDIPLCVVTEGNRSRNYYSTEVSINALNKLDVDIPAFVEEKLNFDPRAIWCPLYGYDKYSDLFNKRQLKSHLIFNEEVTEIHKRVINDAINEGMNDDNINIEDKGRGARAYADAIAVYLTLINDKLLDWNSTMCSWIPNIEGVGHTFSKQGLPLNWMYFEINPFSNSAGNYLNHIEWTCAGILNPNNKNVVKFRNLDSCENVNYKEYNPIISTDPPYYDMIGYSDLSDFFYVWQRNILRKAYPSLFSTMLTPKKQELVAIPYRFEGNKQKAEEFFRTNMEKVFHNIRDKQNTDFPITIYYAFKQKENVKDSLYGTTSHSTGWDVMLSAIISAKLQIVGTWPLRTERSARSLALNANSLASSILIVCRKKITDGNLSTRREFISELKRVFPNAIKNMQDTEIAPVDMAQSAIGPGMAVFSKYSKVLEADGNQMSVRTALQIINQELDAFLTEQESDMDQETRFCIAWYEQFSWKEGPFGDANTLATAKGTAVNALNAAGVVSAKAGKVRLLKRSELDDDWDPTTDKKLTVWECVQHLIKRLDQEGEDSVAKIIRKIGGLAESVKELTYRLYSMCEKKGWTEDGIAYNTLISSWQSISDKAQYYDKVSEETKKGLKDKTQKRLMDTWGED